MFFFAVGWCLADDVIVSANGTAGFSKSDVVDEHPQSATKDVTCPDGSLWSQTPHGPSDSWSAATSDLGPTQQYLVYDNFAGAAGANAIRFWGLNAYNAGAWAPCSENPVPFTITFYADTNGYPGPVLATYNETLTGVGTGVFYATSYELMEYNTILDPVPPLTGQIEWVSVQGGGDPTCWFLWMSSGDIFDGSSYQWDGSNLNVYGYDNAFCLYTELPGEDWGDAPDSYQTLAASNGALHPIVPGMFLGTAIDGEADGQPSPSALLDDNTGFPDDEDGVVFTNLVVIGNIVNVKVTASMPGFLDAWVDFNDNGTWADAGENIFFTQPLNPGVNMLSFTVPAGIAPGTTYSRWRYSSVGGLPFDGPGPDGEVEDYRVFIQEPLENIKWYQPPDLDNTGMDVDMFPWESPDIDGLTDDFLCTQTGPITDIHFWASFFEDVVPPLPFQVFEVTIYSDIPAGVYAPWSMPGEILWRYYFTPGGYLVTQVTDNNPEDYYYSIPQLFWLNDDHLNCYQYDFFIDPDSAFFQEEGIIYWLGIRDMTYDGTYRFGWKTTTLDTRWNDDATYLCDPPMFWCDIHYPPGHEFMDLSLDLAFALSTEQACDCQPGEANADGTINIFDITYLITYLYLGGPAPVPYALCNGDPNCDCTCNIFDITYLIQFLYLSGPPPCTCQQWLAACGPPLRK